MSHRADAMSHLALVVLGALLLLVAAEQARSTAAAWIVGVALLGIGVRGLLVMLVHTASGRRRPRS